MNDQLKSPRSKLNVVIESLEQLKNNDKDNQTDDDFLGIDFTAARPSTTRQKNVRSWEEFDIFRGINFEYTQPPESVIIEEKEQMQEERKVERGSPKQMPNKQETANSNINTKM